MRACFFPTMWGHSKCFSRPGRGSSPEPKCAVTQISSLRIFRTGRNKCSLSKFLSLCYFVIATGTNQENPQITPSYIRHYWSLRKLPSHQLLNNATHQGIQLVSSLWLLPVNMTCPLMSVTLPSLRLHLNWVFAWFEIGSLLLLSSFQLLHLLVLPGQHHHPSPVQTSRVAQPQAVRDFTAAVVQSKPSPEGIWRRLGLTPVLRWNSFLLLSWRAKTPCLLFPFLSGKEFFHSIQISLASYANCFFLFLTENVNTPLRLLMGFFFPGFFPPYPGFVLHQLRRFNHVFHVSNIFPSIKQNTYFITCIH